MPETVIAGVSCAQVLASLGDYLDHELPADETERLEAHLTQCERCERFGRGVGEMLVSTHRMQASAPLDAALRASILAKLDADPDAADR